MPYARFAVMIALLAIALFCLSYLNVYDADHLWFSAGRVWMAIAGAATAAVLIVFLAPDEYPNGAANSVIVAAAVTIFAACVWLVRTEDGVHETEFMRAMIPHHSAAILAAERAHLRDPRVRALAQRIANDQTREIAEMEQLIADIKQSGGKPAAPTREGQAKTVSR